MQYSFIHFPIGFRDSALGRRLEQTGSEHCRSVVVRLREIKKSVCGCVYKVGLWKCLAKRLLENRAWHLAPTERCSK